jgi:hypothetical protein
MAKPAVNSEKKVLVLQGGGALGAYQAGAYETLAAAGHEPEWVAGVSIGAINASIIAGNPAGKRVERLRQFWELVSSRLTLPPLAVDDASRKLFNETSAALVASTGAPGFFEPRYPPAIVMPPGTVNAISLYDTGPLRDTLLELVDFDLLNSGPIRLSVGAVDVGSGNLKYFDSKSDKIGPEHIMASGALPPGFPPVGSTVTSIGTAGSSRIRRCSTCSITISRAQTCAFSKSICSAPKAPYQKHFSTFKSARRRSDIQAAHVSIPMSHAACRRCAVPFAGLKMHCPTKSRPASTGIF